MPFVPVDWLKDGAKISVRNAPTAFGPVSYAFSSHLNDGYIEVTLQDRGETHLCKFDEEQQNYGGGWSVDYPRADLNLSFRLAELTTTAISRDERGEIRHIIIRLTDAELFRCPFVMMTEPGGAFLDAMEAAALRSYLLKGGFLWADDFWGSRAWAVWANEIAKVLPPSQHPIVDVDLTHELFHSLYDVREKLQVPAVGWWVEGRITSERGLDSAEPHVRAIFDDDRRIMVLMTHNTDFGDAFEREGENREYFDRFAADGYADLAPGLPLAQSATPVFAYLRYHDEPVRVATVGRLVSASQHAGWVTVRVAETLGSREELADEIDVFEAQIELKRQGKLDDKVFAETRLRRGAYGQRYDNGQRWDGKETQSLPFPSNAAGLTKGANTVWDAPGMQRIKVPFGGMNPQQLEVMAELAEEYSDGIAHVTTRQDFQLHFVHLEDTPDLMRRLAAVSITTREACGNSVRNVTACPLAGVCHDETFDVTPYSKALAEFLLGHDDLRPAPV